MATGTKGELANVNTCASIWPRFLTEGEHVVFQSRKTERGPIEQKIHLAQGFAILRFTWTSIRSKGGPRDRPNTDAISACRRLRPYRVLLLNHKTFGNVVAVRRGLEICMQ